jgi:hypothetical protein
LFVRSGAAPKRFGDARREFLKTLLRSLAALPEIDVDSRDRPVEGVGLQDRNDVHYMRVDLQLEQAHQRLLERSLDVASRSSVCRLKKVMRGTGSSRAVDNARNREYYSSAALARPSLVPFVAMDPAGGATRAGSILVARTNVRSTRTPWAEARMRLLGASLK